MKCFIAITVISILIGLSVQEEEEFLLISSGQSDLGFNADNKGEFQGIYSKIVEDCSSNVDIEFDIPTKRLYSYYQFTSPTNLAKWKVTEHNESEKQIRAVFQVDNEGPCTIDAEVYVQPE